LSDAVGILLLSEGKSLGMVVLESFYELLNCEVGSISPNEFVDDL